MVEIDKAFLKGLDKPLILWLLSREPMYGYDIIKEVKRLTGRRLKPNSIYPFLHLLEEKGFAVSEWINKRERRIRYYSLTEKGENLLNRIREFFQKPIREILFNLLLDERTG